MERGKNFEDDLWKISNSTLTHKGLKAHIEFNLKGDVIDFQHVFVPESARGRGAAAVVCDKAFEMAFAYGCTAVVPTCTYVSETYIPKRLMAGKLLEVPLFEKN